LDISNIYIIIATNVIDMDNKPVEDNVSNKAKADAEFANRYKSKRTSRPTKMKIGKLGLERIVK
jgi:hypothetical protein